MMDVKVKKEVSDMDAFAAVIVSACWTLLC